MMDKAGKNTCRVAVFSLMLLSLTFSQNDFPDRISAFADDKSSENIKILSTSASPSELTEGDTTIALIIENDRSEDVKLTKIEVISPWHASKNLDITIKPANTQAVPIDLTIPSGVKPDSYTVTVSITDSSGNIMTSYAAVTIKDEKLFEIKYDRILALLGAYYIPAQSIERIMEYFSIFRGKLARREKMLEYEASKESLTRIRDGAIDRFSGNTANSVDSFYKEQISKIDGMIKNNSTNLEKAKTGYAISMWQFGTVLAIVPGALFAFFGLGVLQIVGNSGLFTQIFDAILNAFFIGSGTKPIHDAIDAIKMIRR